MNVGEFKGGRDGNGSGFDSRHPLPREDAAHYLIARRAVIRARITRKIRRAWRGFAELDIDDLESSVLRRIDLALLRGILKPCSEREFWAYVLVVVDNVVLEKLRSCERYRRALDIAAQGLRRLVVAFHGCRDNDQAAQRLHELIMALPNDDDRELLLWRLDGVPHATIAVATGKSESAVRRQWARICRRLRTRFAPPLPPRGKMARSASLG